MKRRFGSFFYHQKPRGVDIARKRWNIFAIISKIIKRACMALGVFVFSLLVISFLAGIFMGGKAAPSLPKDMILVYNITDGVGESHIPASFSDPFALPSLNVREVIETLDYAARDKRVRGLLVSLDSANIDLAHIQELRAAITRFRAAGKFAHIFSASFSDLGSGIGAYYFASSFEEIWMQPVGFLSITGLSIEMPFARALLDKVGATPEFLHREDYKSAMESFTNTSMSPANREMMQSILDDYAQQMTKDITQSRKISNALWQKYMNQGLLTGQQALKAGLITHLDYADVMIKSVREKISGDAESEEPPVVLIEDYFDAAVDGVNAVKKSNVALVNITGEIVPGAEYEPGFATGDYIASAIFDAAKDDAIKVIVIRVDSPGGSPTASETIRRSIVYAKEKGKKVVVSMGPTAASGGYWVAVDADKIFAMPATLTGSIGVIMGKFELSRLWQKLGVTWDGMSWGDNADLWSMNKSMSESQRAALNTAIDDTYDAFLTRVSEGRKIEKSKVREIAKGRAWTGAQALKLGLVDELGGLDSALDEAAKLVGAQSRHDIHITIMPKPLTPLEQLLMLTGQKVLMGDMGFSKTLLQFFHQGAVMERSGPLHTYNPQLDFVR